MRILRPLRARPVALLWSGLSLSALGDQLYAVALTWIAVGVLGRYAGYLSALQMAVVLVAVLGVGQWADRRDHRHNMVATDLLRAAVLLLVVLVWIVQGHPAAPMLVLAVVVLAFGQAVFQPSMQAMLPGVVADDELLPAANGLLDATERSARLLGPGLVGLLAGTLPVMHFLSIDAASFVASALALIWIGRLVPGDPRASRAVRAREPMWRGIARGVAAMRSHPVLGYVLATTGPNNGAWYAAMYLALPLLIEQRGIVGPGGSGLAAYGLVISAYGCTNLAATIVLGGRPLPRRPQFQMNGGTALVGLGTALMAASGLLPDAWLLPGLMASAAIGAAGGPMSDIPQAVLRQTRLPQPDRASAMRVKMAASSFGALAAMLVAPSLIATAGVLPVLAACGGVMMAIGLGGVLLLADWREDAAASAGAPPLHPVQGKP